MTRRDYVLIAGTIAKTYNDTFALLDHDDAGVRLGASFKCQAITQVACDLATALKDENPRFDLPRFLDAALPQHTV